MIQLTEQPWQEGDDFTVEETGVRYVYDGENLTSKQYLVSMSGCLREK